MGLLHRPSRRLFIVADALFADGLDTTVYIKRIEREFNVCIPDDDGTEINTLGQLCDYVSAKCDGPARNATEDLIWLTLRRITSDEFGVMESDLHKETRFVEDLMC